jgi:valyl-tRNA synthetase
MGHALNTVLQDILSRWKRMSGYKVLWLPGTDHAGIATQNVVEKQLASEGLDRHKIGRNAFIERVWQWKAEYGGKIIHQLKRLGVSCDWSRERFTLDKGLSEAVREVFVRLYEEGLIYRDNRLINWCPRCNTALSDLEVEHEELEGKLTYIKYPLTPPVPPLIKGGYITVATTRPETMLGDTAVAVHPDDSRYKDFTGKTVDLPLTKRKIVIISDKAVDPSFGTGAVKVTPAHDFNDEALAKRQSPTLEFITVIGADGRMTSSAGERYAGLDRYECRKLVLKDLNERNLVEKKELHKYAIGHCYRCKTITEPLSTLQWYMNVQNIAKDAIRVVKEGKIKIIPRTWENTYFAWMEDIKDWCISRQIWWGHRIPVWYCEEMKNEKCRMQNGINVSRETPKECLHCGSRQLIQDEDVLDTWFSSALWPFSTLGWPVNTDDLKTFYPTSVLVTGFDIIFFWVARMIMIGLKFMGDVPFRDVYIHALVRDIKGQKMSKSKGNVVDPLIMMDRYGTDAFRFTLAAFAAQGRDIKFSEERVEGYRHFVNKLWNAARFILMNIKTTDSQQLTLTGQKHRPHDLASKWILSRLAATADDVNRALEEYRFNDAASSIYQFIWHEFCDWYLEMAKTEINPPTHPSPSRGEGKGWGEISELRTPSSEAGVRWCLMHTLDTSLRLLHPFMPFVTEEIWQKIPHVRIEKSEVSPPTHPSPSRREGKGWGGNSELQIQIGQESEIKESIMISDYPKLLQRDPEAEEYMSYIIEAITGIRTIRGELNISPSLKLNVSLKTFSQISEKILRENLRYLKNLAKISDVEIGMNIEKPECSATSVKNSMEIYVPLKGVLNIDAEIDRLKKDDAKVEKSIASLNKKLLNEDFLQKAPKEIVDKERTKYEDLIKMRERIAESIKILKGAEVKDNA